LDIWTKGVLVTNDSSQDSIGSAPPSGNGLLALLCTAQLVLTLDFSIVNVALPTIQRELHFSPADLQWIVTGYALTFGSLLLLSGRAGDLLGRRRLLVCGLLVFVVASLTCGFAQTSLMLVVSRIVQGIGGAMISPTALALLTSNNPEGPARSRALGLWQAAAAGGASLGVVLGGLLVQYVDWRAIFLINIPIVAVLLFFVPKTIGPSQRVEGVRLDYTGATLATVSIASLIFGLSSGEQRGFTSSVTLLALSIFVILGAAFLLVERRVPSPMVPLSILAGRSRRAADIAMLVMGTVVVAYVYFASLYLQRVLHFSPLATGLCFIPATLTVMSTATLLTRRLLGRVGVKPILISGLTSIGLGQFWLAHIHSGGSYGVDVLPGLLLTTFGMGLAFPATSVGATAGVAPSEQGSAAALFNTSQQVGSAVGLSILATIAAANARSVGGTLTSGFRLSYLIGTGIAVLGIILVATMLSARQCQSELALQRGASEVRA
jgi:EmrB/QacA subfamily drug resistance transporter